MALLPRHKTPPTVQPIVANVPLTAEERTRLEADPRLQHYPMADYLSKKERGHLTFVAWCHQQGDE